MAMISAIACPLCTNLKSILSRSSTCLRCGAEVAIKISRATKYQESWECGLRLPDGKPCIHSPCSLQTNLDTPSCNNMTHARYVFRLLQRDVHDISKSLWSIVSVTLRDSMGANESESRLMRRFSEKFHQAVQEAYAELADEAYPNATLIKQALNFSTHDEIAALRTKMILHPGSLAAMNQLSSISQDLIFAVITNSTLSLILKKRNMSPSSFNAIPYDTTEHVKLYHTVNEVAALTGDDHLLSIDAFCVTVAKQMMTHGCNTYGQPLIPTNNDSQGIAEKITRLVRSQGLLDDLLEESEAAHDLNGILPGRINNYKLSSTPLHRNNMVSVRERISDETIAINQLRYSKEHPLSDSFALEICQHPLQYRDDKRILAGSPKRFTVTPSDVLEKAIWYSATTILSGNYVSSIWLQETEENAQLASTVTG